MKKCFLSLIVLVAAGVLFFLIFPIGPRSASGEYLLPAKNGKILYPSRERRELPLPFEGILSEPILIPPLSVPLTINGLTVSVKEPSFLLPTPNKVVLKASLTNLPYWKESLPGSSPFKRVKKGETLSFGNRPHLVTLLLRTSRSPLTTLIHRVCSEYTVPEEGEISLASSLTEEEWKREHSDFLQASYLSIDNSTFQVHPLFTPERLSLPLGKSGKARRLSLYVGCVPSLDSRRVLFSIGDGAIFTVRTRQKGVWRDLFSKRVRNSVELLEGDLPKDAEEITVQASPGRDSFGDLAFITPPYLFHPQEKRRLVILLSLDTVRASSLSLYGNKRKTTPFLDEWAPKEARIYRNAFTPHPWTTPAHGAMLFGVYSWEEKVRSLAEQMQQEGFYTSAVTGGNLVAANNGFARGFTYYRDNNLDIFDRHAGAYLFERIKNALNVHKGKDLFLFFHTYHAHSPYTPATQFQVLGATGEMDINAARGGIAGTYSPLPEETRRKALLLYEEEILALDQELLAPLVSYLKRSGEYENTELVILSDHGEQFYEHGAWEHGYSLYNEETHIPLIVHSPGLKQGWEEDPISLRSVPLLVSRLAHVTPHETWKREKGRPPLFSTAIEYSALPFPLRVGVINNGVKVIANLKSERGTFRDYPNNEPRFESYDFVRDPGERKNTFSYKDEKIKEGLSYLKPLTQSLRQTKSPASLSEEKRERLKSLGYVD